MTRIKLRYVNEYRDCHGKLRRYFQAAWFASNSIAGPTRLN